MNCHFCSANSGVTEKVNFRFRRLEETQNFELCELKPRKHHGKKCSPLHKKKICVFDVRLIFFNRSIFIRLTFVKYLAMVQSQCPTFSVRANTFYKCFVVFFVHDIQGWIFQLSSLQSMCCSREPEIFVLNEKHRLQCKYIVKLFRLIVCKN